MSDQTHDDPADRGCPDPGRTGPDRAPTDRAPTDRDSAERAPAERSQLEPDRADAERTERAFNDIVARFGDSPDGVSWPAEEDIARPRPLPVVVVRPARPARPADPDAPTETDLPVVSPGFPTAGPGHNEDHGADEGHYVPPPAPPVPPMRPATRAAVASIVFGVGLLVVPNLTGWAGPVGLDTLAVLFVLGGVGALVARMREHRFDRDDGETWDDGAEV